MKARKVINDLFLKSSHSSNRDSVFAGFTYYMGDERPTVEIDATLHRGTTSSQIVRLKKLRAWIDKVIAVLERGENGEG